MPAPRDLLIVALLVLALRVPFLNQAIQGDDVYYLAEAQHAQIEPLHPKHVQYAFMGRMVDMRGQPHPPLNAWFLALLLATLKDISEIPFHVAYILFSLIAALSMWSLARRFCERPLLATLAFIAVPAFVVNGNSLEADLPFLALWMLAVAMFVKAVEEDSIWALAVAKIAAILAGLAAYQAILLTPILAVYLLRKRSRWTVAWLVIFAAPAAIVGWQIFEWSTRGALPLAILAGYMKTYGLQAGSNKLRSAAALIVHAGWIISPLIVLAWRAPFSKDRWRWIVAAIVAGCAAFYDPNPLFWLSFGCGVLLLASCAGREFLDSWVLIFFGASAFLFFAGSARYLLPMAAPVAILAVRAVNVRVVGVGIALQVALGLALAVVNFEHWGAYRTFAASLPHDKRTWINAEWGLRFYLESDGGLAMPKNPPLRAGDMVVSSELAFPMKVNAPTAPLKLTEIRPSIPLRLISLDGRSAYSVASARGLLPFEISTGPIDVVRADIVIERKPELSWIDPKDPAAAAQMVSGIYPDGWISDQASVVLKRPAGADRLELNIYIPDPAPARRITLSMDGRVVGDETFSSPGVHTISARETGASNDVTVTIAVDKTFSTGADQRRLGVVVTGIGFK